MHMPNLAPPPTVLIICADWQTRQEFQELLVGTDFHLEICELPQESLARAEEILPSVILIDLDEKNFNSLETCRRIRNSRLLTGLPILMLSERGNRDERAAGLSAGADDFLEKPFDGLEILARLRTFARLNVQINLLADLQRFSWVVEHAQEGYLLLDRANSIHYANERAQNLLNMPEDYLGLPFRHVVERLYVPQPADSWMHWDSDPSPCFLVQPETPTARAVWLVLEGLDTTLGVEYQRIARLRDVTERMALYQDMRRFHTVIAHKLRTPMSIMVSNLSIIKNKLEMLKPEEVKDFAQGAIGGAERLANEIRSILTYIDSPLALNLGQPTPLSQLPEIVQALGKILAIKELYLSLPDHLRDQTLAITPEALEIALHELFENARKFHPEHNPRLEISVSQPKSDTILLRVADNGTILSAEQLSWAWLPYFQGEKDFTGEVPGLGLGFPMVATLAWKAGGDIHLRNRHNGQGVIVDLEIPLEDTVRRIERPASPFGA
jgi:signal transduction histidine kinase